MARRTASATAQAWVTLLADDPEAVSALAVARAHLPAARALQGLARHRLIELRGRLPAREALAALLHGSIQFYNPHKERCVVRRAASDATPIAPGTPCVLVFERDGARRGAAERWWRHETGVEVEVVEGVVWALAFANGGGAEAARDLAELRDRRHGLFANPHAQEWRIASDAVPLPWIVT
jgi:hypothetical protein